MEGSSSSSRAPEITIVPAPRPAAGGGSVDVLKAASKEAISPGSPSAGGGKVRRPEVAVSLPGWKLDSLCKESASPPAMMARFPYF